MKISIIGYGEMAKAILYGMKNGNWKMENIEIVGRNEEKMKQLSNKIGCKYALIDGYDISKKIVILTVKPYALKDVAKKIKGEAEVLISILAGKSLNELKENIKSKSYIRAMPNIAAKYQSSTTAITGDKSGKGIANKILSKIGEVVWVENDDEIDMATAIIGSGPAFLALIAEAISDGGVYSGLKRDVADRLVEGLFESFSVLAKKEDFSIIKNKVSSPKGTTIEGVYTLEKGGIRGKIMEGVVKTYEKSKKI